MNKLYNTQDEITSDLEKIIRESDPNIRKTQTNIIPSIIYGMVFSESVVASDIAKVLKNYFDNIFMSSIIKRINRFYNNVLFKPYDFYDKVIHLIIKNYKKKHDDTRVHIVFDHMFSKDNYTVFMITMRVGKQGIPLWFRCFKGKSNVEAFKIELLKEGISYVSNLFDEDFDLIFLADRWFNSTELMEHINSLGHTYCLRLKGNIKVFNDGKYIKAKKLKKRKFKSTKYEDILITDKNYKTNLIISDSIDTSTPWIIVTNGDINRAIKDYSYRYGAIESVFKNQKSNGFNLEKVCNASIEAFTTMYTLTCFCTTYLVILGADYSKNTKCYRKCKITTHKTYIINNKKIKKRVMSLFNTGLTLFKRAINSTVYIRLPFSLKLYDI